MAKRGTLNQGLRMEWLMARLSMQVSAALGGKLKFKDFIRYHDTEDDRQLTDQDISFEAFAAMYGANVKKG